MTSFKKIGGWNFFLEYSKKYGETFVVWLGRRPIVMTSNAENVKKVRLLIIMYTGLG